MLPSTILAGLLAAAQVPEPPAPAAEITWRAPASCPGRAILIRGIQTRLGRSLRVGELGIDGVVSVHPTAPRYRLTLRLRVAGRGELRTLSAETCSALADATAVLVALAVEASPPATARARPEDPTDMVEADDAVDVQTPTSTVPEPPVLPTQPLDVPVSPDPPDPPEPPIIEAEPVTNEPAPAPAPPAVVAPPSRRPGAFVRLHGGPELGALSKITGMVGLATGLLWKRARLEFQGLYLAPRTGQHPLGDVRASLAAGAVHGCARLGPGRLEVPLCGGLELGSMRGTIDGGGTVQNWWLGAVLGAGVTLHVTRRLSLWSALQMVGPIVRPNFVAEGPGPAQPLLKTPAPVTGRLLLGIEIKFSDPR